VTNATLYSFADTLQVVLVHLVLVEIINYHNSMASQIGSVIKLVRLAPLCIYNVIGLTCALGCPPAAGPTNRDARFGV
jgi:hypothetical protein